MPKRYPAVKAGEWVQPVRKGYKMACCDCGLVHVMNFRIRKGRVQLQAFRDNRATAQIRRRRHV
jgi:hypothetical protein